MIGAFVELGVQRHHAAICILQFLVQPLQLFLPGAELVHLHQDLLVLLADFLHRVGGTVRRQRAGDAPQAR